MATSSVQGKVIDAGSNIKRRPVFFSQSSFYTSMILRSTELCGAHSLVSVDAKSSVNQCDCGHRDVD